MKPRLIIMMYARLVKMLERAFMILVYFLVNSHKANQLILTQNTGPDKT